VTYNDVVKFYGTASKASRATGVSKQAISSWKVRGRIPFEAQYKIQLKTRGKLKAVLAA
jgi:hypothetical protein